MPTMMNSTNRTMTCTVRGCGGSRCPAQPAPVSSRGNRAAAPSAAHPAGPAQRFAASWLHHCRWHHNTSPPHLANMAQEAAVAEEVELRDVHGAVAPPPVPAALAQHGEARGQGAPPPSAALPPRTVDAAAAAAANREGAAAAVAAPRRPSGGGGGGGTPRAAAARRGALQGSRVRLLGPARCVYSAWHRALRGDGTSSAWQGLLGGAWSLMGWWQRPANVIRGAHKLQQTRPPSKRLPFFLTPSPLSAPLILQ